MQLDESVDPCDDFFKFSCGGWIAANPIPPHRNSWYLYNKMEEENNYFIANLLSSSSFDLRDYPESLRKTKLVYDSCVQSKQDQISNNKVILQVILLLMHWCIIHIFNYRCLMNLVVGPSSQQIGAKMLSILTY